MNSSVFICTIILIVLSSCLPPCQNVEEEKKNEVLEVGDNTKHITLLRVIREADGIEAEGVSERAKDAPKKKSKTADKKDKSVSKKSAEKKTASDGKLKKLTKKHGDTVQSHKVIAINTTTSAHNDSTAHGLESDINDINSAKNLSSLMEGSEKNSSRAVKGDLDAINQAETGHVSGTHNGLISSGSQAGLISGSGHDGSSSSTSHGGSSSALDYGGTNNGAISGGGHYGSVSADADEKDENDESSVIPTAQGHHTSTDKETSITGENNLEAEIQKGIKAPGEKGPKAPGEKGPKAEKDKGIKAEKEKGSKAEGDSKKGNKHKPVNVAVDHSDGAKKGDSEKQRDSSDDDSAADSGPKVNMTANDDATNITATVRGGYRLSPMKLKQRIL